MVILAGLSFDEEKYLDSIWMAVQKDHIVVVMVMVMVVLSYHHVLSRSDYLSKYLGDATRFLSEQIPVKVTQAHS